MKPGDEGEYLQDASGEQGGQVMQDAVDHGRVWSLF